MRAPLSFPFTLSSSPRACDSRATRPRAPDDGRRARAATRPPILSFSLLPVISRERKRKKTPVRSPQSLSSPPSARRRRPCAVVPRRAPFRVLEDAEPRAPGRERRIRRGHRAQERRRDGVQRASKRDGRSRDRPRGSIESARSTILILSKPRLAFKRATTDRPTYCTCTCTRDRSQKLTAGDLLLQKTLDQRGHWLWVDVNSSALEAVQRMTRANVGALLVMRERVLDVDADGVVTREEASRCVFFVLVFVFLFFCFFPPPPPPRTRTLTAAAAVPPKSLPFSSSSRHAQRQMGRRRRGRRHRARLPP